MPDYLASLGFVFLEQTKLSRKGPLSREREVIAPASAFKEYPEAQRLKLSRPHFVPAPLWEALAKRRSIRKYQNTPLSLEDLSLLLFAAQGITAKFRSYFLRTAPSAGALYPIETYLCVNNVDDLPSGLYHLEVRSFSLELLSSGNFGKALAEACLGQNSCAQAPVVMVWSAVARRTMSKYGSRGMRYIFMDVAHICQNVLLAAAALGLGACPIGAFFDEEVNALFGLDGQEESVIYLATVGHPVA